MRLWPTLHSFRKFWITFILPSTRIPRSSLNTWWEFGTNNGRGLKEMQNSLNFIQVSLNKHWGVIQLQSVCWQVLELELEQGKRKKTEDSVNFWQNTFQLMVKFSHKSYRWWSTVAVSNIEMVKIMFKSKSCQWSWKSSSSKLISSSTNNRRLSLKVWVKVWQLLPSSCKGLIFTIINLILSKKWSRK